MEMVVELAAERTLAHPERFAEAHAIAMRALEVLDRNGARPPSSLRLGVFTPVARWGAQLVCRYIVRSHQNRVVDAIRNLYARGLAWCPSGSSDRLMLLRARADVERAASAYKKRPNGLPTFLLGGAVVSTLARVAGGAVTRDRVERRLDRGGQRDLPPARRYVVGDPAPCPAVVSARRWIGRCARCGRPLAAAVSRRRTRRARSRSSAPRSRRSAGCSFPQPV
jgi:hypothetical protein